MAAFATLCIIENVPLVETVTSLEVLEQNMKVRDQPEEAKAYENYFRYVVNTGDWINTIHRIVKGRKEIIRRSKEPVLGHVEPTSFGHHCLDSTKN